MQDIKYNLASAVRICFRYATGASLVKLLIEIVTETVSAGDFIKRLILHIPDKHFKMIRYYGIYSKHHVHSPHLVPAVSIQKRRFLSSLNDWRTSLLLDFGVDLLLCACGNHMTCLDICINGILLSDFYRKSFDSS